MEHRKNSMLQDVPIEILSAQCPVVTDPDEARDLVRVLHREWMRLDNCIGLAAPQIGVSKAVAIIRDAKTGISYNLVNPKIIWKENPFINENEGCMSSPGRLFNVQRYENIKIENYSPWPSNDDGIKTPMSDIWDMNGGVLIRQEAAFCLHQPQECMGGIIAIAIQHEIDHLNGVCLPWNNDAIEKQNDPIIKDSEIGRNDPCPCGSGKKYKKCCLIK